MTLSPLTPTTPPRPSCRTRQPLSFSSSAIVSVVGSKGISKEVGSGKRCVLSHSSDAQVQGLGGSDARLEDPE